MTNFDVIFSSTDFNVKVDEPWNPVYSVNKYSWDAFGGPLQAEIDVYGSDEQLRFLAKKLRQPVLIKDMEGFNCWWGYVHEARVAGQTISLKDIANRVAVRYNNFPSAGPTSTGTSQTPFIQDDWSVSNYGIIEKIFVLGTLDTTNATIRRNQLLLEHRFPKVDRISPITGVRKATLICKGWMNTLDWVYIPEELTPLAVETSELIETYATIAGQFLIGVNVFPNSNLFESQIRDGTTTGLQELLSETGQSRALLKLPDSNDNRYVTLITPERYMWVQTVDDDPTFDLRLKVTDLGRLVYSDFADVEIPQHRMPAHVGRYLALSNVNAYIQYLGRTGDPARTFLERITYSTRNGQVDIKENWSL